jgi:hypothetical protein
MKLVVYGPQRRVGIVHDDRVIDASGAFAKYAFEVMDERLPYEVAAATVPDELGKFIDAGERAIDGATRAVEYLTRRAADHRGRARRNDRGARGGGEACTRRTHNGHGS